MPFNQKKFSGTEDDNTDFTFVVTTSASKQTAEDKKKVRSAAALSSWPERRKRIFEQVDEREAGQGKFYLDTSYRARQPSTTRKKARAEQTSSGNAVSQPAGHARDGNLHGSFQVASGVVQPLVRKSDHWKSWVHGRAAETYGLGVQEGLKRPGDLALATPPATPGLSPCVTDMADPFNCYPVEYQPWFDRVLHHMLTEFAPRGWPALKITREQGIMWEHFMTQHALSDPALFYVRLLFACGDMIRLGVLRRETSWWCQAKAIQSINEALANQKRATSDPLILAAGRIALHESMYGDRSAAHKMHRPAQAQMIRMRGGMKNLQMPGLVKRLMRWSDTVMAKQGNTQRFIEDDDDRENFTMNQSVSVLERWVPEEGQQLRRKIRISDLVND
ncbi:hypothetical protein KC340_g6009 [Hortaea werneckii]|nr:hypothetical protein KC342_g8096 [Hortaea werneckii]KAI7099250.1 hypothetical protein KC339_g8376 [Hortaea werneckii]KAI7227179.1 hypothetical protein KC365_g9034 [Hortaea werneckii]KAI7325881.1 hypothetical protein KC340_g6009 [Hortaea werneckii]KAI7396382.1 hypothetical protein KC328_g5342 [Hortaea werneckii]